MTPDLSYDQEGERIEGRRKIINGMEKKKNKKKKVHRMVIMELVLLTLAEYQ